MEACNVQLSYGSRSLLASNRAAKYPDVCVTNAALKLNGLYKLLFFINYMGGYSNGVCWLFISDHFWLIRLSESEIVVDGHTGPSATISVRHRVS